MKVKMMLKVKSVIVVYSNEYKICKSVVGVMIDAIMRISKVEIQSVKTERSVKVQWV